MTMSNAAYSAQDEFKAACEAAGIPATAAQASKYRRGYRIAYTTQHNLPVGSKIMYKNRSEGADGQRATGKCGKVDASKGLHLGPYTTF